MEFIRRRIKVIDMINLYFTITPQNFLYRTDSNLIQNQIDEEYICHFQFENEDWDDVEKFVTFSIKNNKYTASLGAEANCSSPIPYSALQNCIINIRVHGEDIITRNSISLVVSQPKNEIIYNCQDQEDYRDVYAEIYHRLEGKIDEAQLVNNDIVFYAEGNEISRISLGDIATRQANWSETDEESPQYIQNKPEIINNFRYENDNLLCLLDNEVRQSISLKHNHPSEDIVDFDDEVDVDLNNLLISITENIRSL